MIELKNDRLVFSFPEIHPNCVLEIAFQRTLRIPDDGQRHFLPPGLGNFPLRHVDDFAERAPDAWKKRGGVMLPMYQAEAMWLQFSSPHRYPFAVKVAAGKINAVTGEEWKEGLQQYPQNYLSVPEQPWLDGYVVEKGVVRQFVAMPLGSGYSAEEQLTGKAEHGGLQIQVFPLKKEFYTPPPPPQAYRAYLSNSLESSSFALRSSGVSYTASMDMGLAAGGSMKQEIYTDRRDFKQWDVEQSSRCFVHLCNSLVWRSVTGQNPPTTPPTAAEYSRAGLPWYDYYAADQSGVQATDTLKGLKGIAELAKQKGDNPLPENESVTPGNVVKLKAPPKKTPYQVREGEF